jgi:subtilisin family serine protease
LINLGQRDEPLTDVSQAAKEHAEPTQQLPEPRNYDLSPLQGENLYKTTPRWSSDQSGAAPAAVENPALNDDAVAKELSPNTVTGVVKAFKYAQTLFPADFSKEENRLRAFINFPYKTKNDYPAAFRGGSVAVIDGWIDPLHCVFNPATRFDIMNLSSSPGLAGKRPASCDQMESADKDRDHGTHVTGLIAGDVPDPNDPPIGLNPYVRLIGREIDISRLEDGSRLVDLAKMILELRLRDHVDVVNMSWGYYFSPVKGGVTTNDPVESAIAQVADSILVVAAAGNDGLDKSIICDIRPVCFDLPNVIAVSAIGGTAAKPTFLQDNNHEGENKYITNYGSHIHLAGLGENIFSTTSNGRYGLLSGTSQAAPQVTAVASLLFARYKTLTPQEVKNRLIYTSNGFAGGKLFGGELNAKWALEGDNGRVRKKDGGEVRGKLGGIPVVHFSDSMSGRKIALPTEAVRGIEYDSVSQTYTVFYNEDQYNRDSKLLKNSGLNPDDPNAEMKIYRSGEATVQLRLQEIEKFASEIR